MTTPFPVDTTGSDPDPLSPVAIRVVSGEGPEVLVELVRLRELGVRFRAASDALVVPGTEIALRFEGPRGEPLAPDVISKVLSVRRDDEGFEACCRFLKPEPGGPDSDRLQAFFDLRGLRRVRPPGSGAPHARLQLGEVSFEGTVGDLSVSGLGLAFTEPLEGVERGQSASVRLAGMPESPLAEGDEMDLVVRVQHATRRSSGVLVGVEIDYDATPDPRVAALRLFQYVRARRAG